MRTAAAVILVFFLTIGVTDAASPPPPAAVLLKAEEWFHRFETGDIDRGQLNALVNAQLTDAIVRKEGAVLRSFGDVTSLTYDFLLQFAAGRIVEMMAFDPDGKIAGIDFATFLKAPNSAAKVPSFLGTSASWLRRNGRAR